MSAAELQNLAVRVTQVMDEYRTLQHYIAQSNISPPTQEERHEDGYKLIKRCTTKAQKVIGAKYAISPSSAGGSGNSLSQLKKVLLDAHARRFDSKKIYLKISAGVRWAQSRNAILQGQKPQAAHQPQLQPFDQQLQAELAQITDAKVLNDLRLADYHAGRWLAGDPNPNEILACVASAD